MKSIKILLFTLLLLQPLYTMPKIIELTPPALSFEKGKAVPPATKEALTHTIAIFDELATGNYSSEDTHLYAEWATTLLLNYVEQRAYTASIEVEKMHDFFTKGEFTIRKVPQKDRGHNPSYYLREKNADKELAPVAILKDVSALEKFSSFQKHLKNMPLETTVDMHELMGYEIDALLGFNRTPITFGAKIAVTHEGKKEEHRAVLQCFIPNAKAAGSGLLREKDGGKKLIGLSRVKAQILALSGIIKGRGAGHQDNYLMQVENDTIVDCFDIDLEECMIPYNKVDTPKNLALCRMWILGLGQNKKPLDKAMLMLLLHPAIKPLLEKYHETVCYPISKEAIQAQKQRVEIIQKMCRDALENKTALSPRDLYFALFGGKELYGLAKEKGYADIAIFNNILSDPYQHVIKNYANPEKMKKSKQLTKPKSKSAAKQILYENLMLLESACQKECQV